MSQSIYLETGSGFYPKEWVKNGSAWMTVKLQKLFYVADKGLDVAVKYAVAHPAEASIPLPYSRINRHTWKRYSALIIEQQRIAKRVQSKTVSLDVISVDTKVEVSVKQSMRFEVSSIQLLPSWASAIHDWNIFE